MDSFTHILLYSLETASSIASEHAFEYGGVQTYLMQSTAVNTKPNYHFAAASSEDRQVKQAFVIGVRNVLNGIFRQITELIETQNQQNQQNQQNKKKKKKKKKDQKNQKDFKKIFNQSPQTILHFYHASRTIQSNLIKLSDLCCLGDDHEHNNHNNNHNNHNNNHNNKQNNYANETKRTKSSSTIPKTFPTHASGLLNMLYDQVRAEETTTVEQDIQHSVTTTTTTIKDVTTNIPEYLFRESCGKSVLENLEKKNECGLVNGAPIIVVIIVKIYFIR